MRMVFFVRAMHNSAKADSCKKFSILIISTGYDEVLRIWTLLYGQMSTFMINLYWLETYTLDCICRYCLLKFCLLPALEQEDLKSCFFKKFLFLIKNLPLILSRALILSSRILGQIVSSCKLKNLQYKTFWCVASVSELPTLLYGCLLV